MKGHAHLRDFQVPPQQRGETLEGVVERSATQMSAGCSSRLVPRAVQESSEDVEQVRPVTCIVLPDRAELPFDEPLNVDVVAEES